MKSALDEAKKLVHGPRNKTYGPPREDFARTAKMWEGILGIPVTLEKFAMCMMAVKMSRLCHTPGHKDSIIDIAGYAECAWMLLHDK